jgi:hypothetical protein
MFGERKSSEVFFRLHELQVKSFGASTVGRVAQRIDLKEVGPDCLLIVYQCIVYPYTLAARSVGWRSASSSRRWGPDL